MFIKGNEHSLANKNEFKKLKFKYSSLPQIEGQDDDNKDDEKGDEEPEYGEVLGSPAVDLVNETRLS